MVQVKLFLVLLMVALATCTLSAQTTLNDKVAQKAAKGDSQSQYQMGLRYYNGDAETQTKRDYNKAWDWFEKASQQGNSDAKYQIAVMYEEGKGVEINFKKAIKYYRLAAQSGNVMAHYRFAELCEAHEAALSFYDVFGYYDIIVPPSELNGSQEGTEKQRRHDRQRIHSEIASYYAVAAENGHAKAQYRLGQLYEEGRGVSKNMETANKWYKMAADQGGGAIKTTPTQNDKEEEQTLASNFSSKPFELAALDWLQIPAVSQSSSCSIKIGVSSGSKVEDCKIYVNGSLLRGLNAVSNDGYAMVLANTLKLAEGDNIITVEVKNAGGVTKETRTVACQPLANVPSVYERRIALVMGNAKYNDKDKQLKNPVNDATDMANKLEALGFTVIRSFDQTKMGMETAIQEFGSKANKYDVALFYYAGHGLSCAGDNYLVPVDANLPAESYVAYNCTNANLVLDVMDKAGCDMKIVILDACRNNPFARSWNRGASAAGLNIMAAPRGTLIAFATSPGDVAQDGQVMERNSPYTSALLQTLDTPNLSITDFFQEVLEKVARKTNERQSPWFSGSFRGKFYFNKK